jgi:DNA-binding NarL/FixJ family response regulator
MNDGPQPLTGQEEKVLKLVAQAKTNKEIAAALCISPATAKRHLENILRKLNLKNRVGAAVYAVSEKRSIP